MPLEVHVYLPVRVNPPAALPEMRWREIRETLRGPQQELIAAGNVVDDQLRLLGSLTRTSQVATQRILRTIASALARRQDTRGARVELELMYPKEGNDANPTSNHQGLVEVIAKAFEGGNVPYLTSVSVPKFKSSFSVYKRDRNISVRAIAEALADNPFYELAELRNPRKVLVTITGESFTDVTQLDDRASKFLRSDRALLISAPNVGRVLGHWTQ